MSKGQIEKIQRDMCDRYCRFPYECSEEQLMEECERCPLMNLEEEDDTQE